MRWLIAMVVGMLLQTVLMSITLIGRERFIFDVDEILILYAVSIFLLVYSGVESPR